ncbi:MAG: hypothetical protein ACLFRY_05280 [Spirochaetia bacterium]
MEEKLTVIRPTVSSGRAEAILSGVAGSFVPRFKKLIYYPYLWVHFRYSFEKLYGNKEFNAFILVDLIRNQASTADRFEPVEVEPDGETVLSPDVDEEAAFKTARTYLLHSTMHHMKVLCEPKATVVQRTVLHKPFHLVECDHRSKESFHVVVDALTGKYEILPER